MYSEGQSKARIGKVSIDIKANRYRIRFSYPKGKRHELRIAQVNDDGWLTALKAAKLINRDIDLGDFDDTYARYSPTHAKTLEIAKNQQEREYNLIELWDLYKQQSETRIAATTQTYLWKDCDRYLSKTPKHLLELSKASEFVLYLQAQFAASTVATLFRSCLMPAVNLGVNTGLIENNPFSKIKLPKHQKALIQCYEPDEIRQILLAFEEDTYRHKSSPFCHSFYLPYVSFLAWTGCRPEEALCLSHQDIKQKGGNYYIKFSKAYSKGILLPHTKTREIRMFPCNEQLLSLLNNIPRSNALLFPSVNGTYINHQNWRKRNWTKVIEGLIDDGVLEQYLKPYCLRHSFITRLVRDGWDIATVARISGNSPETIIKHYLAAKDSFDIPEL